VKPSYPILIRRVGIAVLVLVLLLVGLTYAGHRSGLLESWTGEVTLVEQLKGTAALALLKLSQPTPQTAPYTPMPYTGVCPYGVNTFLEQEAEVAKVERSLELIRDAGFCWIRQEFPWEDIEISAKGDYWDHKWDIDAWAKYDRIVDLAERYDIEIIARLDRPPAWSRVVGSAEGWTMAPPDNYDDFGDFVYAVVSRYKGRIKYYQIWNEPNIYPEWGDQATDPAAYTKLLQIAYRRAKEADPNCVIIAAALAQTTEETPMIYQPRNLSDLTYLEMMYQAGARGSFDIMGAMVYGLWTGPADQRTSRDRANYARVQLLREIMVRNDDAAVPIWASEVGWNAQPETLEGPVPYGRVTLEQQARYAVQAYQRARDEWPWMGVMNYWFLRRASDAEVNQPWYYFRMFEPDFTPLPVAESMRALMQTPAYIPPGYWQEDHWVLQYTGSWQLQTEPQAVLGAYQRGDQDAAVTLRTNGGRVEVILWQPAQAAVLEVTVDGASSRTIELAAGSEPSRTVVLADRLRPGEHTLALRVVSGTLNLDGLLVYPVPSRAGEWVGLALGAVMLLVATSLILRRKHRVNPR